MSIPFVDLKAQYRSVKAEMDAAILSVLERTAFVLGPDVDAFEQAFATYVGARHCVGINSGTDALQIAVQGLGIGRGDEVITAANTFIASCEAITNCGAEVRLVDVEPERRNLDWRRLEAALSRRTVAIMPVHLYGHPADMAPILDFAAKHKLLVIEDCAQSHGAKYQGKQTGSFGDAGCFSFYPGKNLGAYGDGGAVVTSDARLAGALQLLRNHGQAAKYDHRIVGHCHRLDGLQAAVLGVKLPKLDGWNALRASRAALYDQLLAGIPGISLPSVAPDSTHVYHLYVIRVGGGRRDALLKHLGELGIGVGLHYPVPIHLQAAYAHLGYKKGDFPVSEQLAAEGLSLPMYPELGDDQVRFVSDAVRAFMGC